DIDQRSDLFQKFIDIAAQGGSEDHDRRIEINRLRNLGIAALLIAVVTMPLLSRIDYYVHVTTFLFMIAACLLGIYFARMQHQHYGLSANLYHSLPFTLPILVLVVRTLAS